MAFRQTNDMVKAIADVATGGMASDAINSLAYRIAEIEGHFHTRERWFGISADQSGTDWALADTLNPFVLTSGNNTWGAAAKIFGTSDTPAITDMVGFDPHRILVVASTSNTIYKVQLIYGSGTSAAAISAGQYSSIFVGIDKDNPNVVRRSPTDVSMPVLECGVDQVWARCWNATNEATLSFVIGIHEYPG